MSYYHTSLMSQNLIRFNIFKLVDQLYQRFSINEKLLQRSITIVKSLIFFREVLITESYIIRFQFPSLGEKKTSLLIKKKFSVWEDYPSFDSFFFEKGSGEEARKEFEEDLRTVSESLLSSVFLPGEKEEEILSSIEKLSAWSHFVESLLYLLEKAWKEGRISSMDAKKKGDILNSYFISTDVYNYDDHCSFSSINGTFFFLSFISQLVICIVLVVQQMGKITWVVSIAVSVVVLSSFKS